MSARYLQAVFAIAICFVLPVQADEGRPAPVRSITTIDTERASILLDQHWNPERQTLRRIQEEGRDRVRDLTRRCQSLAPGQERRELEQQIVQLKREYEKRFLDARTALNRDLGFEPDATTAWSGDGSPVCTDNAQQHYPKTAADDAGGAYVVWVDERGTDQIYIQRLTSGGAVYPGWPVNGFPVTPTPPDVQSDPSIASDGSGGALIAWDQRDPVYMDWDIYVQRITGIGTRATGWPAGGVDVGYAIENQLEPRVISDGTGGAIVAWWDYRNPGTNSIYAGRVSNTGTKLWTSGGEWVASDVTALIVPPPICSDGANGVYLAWEGAQGGSNTDVFVQRLDSAGQVPVGWPSGGENFVPTTRYQTQPDIIPDGSGGAVLAWADYRSASDYDIYAMRITAGSNRYPGWTSTGVPVSAQAGSDQLDPLLVSDGNGGALVTWSDQRHPVPYIFCSKVTGREAWSGLRVTTGCACASKPTPSRAIRCARMARAA